jgi:hypothetical protein
MTIQAIDLHRAAVADRVRGGGCPDPSPKFPAADTRRRRRVDPDERSRHAVPTSIPGLAALALLLILPVRALADVPRLSADDSGVVSVLVDNQPRSSIFLSVLGPTNGSATQMSTASYDPPTGSGSRRDYSGVFAIPGSDGDEVSYRQTVAERNGQSADLSYRIRLRAPDGTVDLHRLRVFMTLDATYFRGRSLSIEGEPAPVLLPNDPNTGVLAAATASGFAIDLPSGLGTLTVVSGTPVFLRVYDSRVRDGDSFEIEFVLQEDGTLFDGDEVAADLMVSVTPQLRVRLEPELAITDTSGWIKRNQAANKPSKSHSALDASYLLDPPAGKYGTLRVVDDHFEFANRAGTPIRFFGTNVSFSACCPDETNAARIAKKLARHGFNLVRFHHMDSPGNERQIIDYAQGSSRELNADNLRHFDYFFNQLKKRGIYAYIDLFVSRRARAGDGIENWQLLNETSQGMKGYALIDPTMIALQKEYAEKLLTHVNPYTKLAYKDDPAFALTEIINESNLFRDKITVEPYATAFEQMWHDWLSGEGLSSATPKTGSEYKRFIADITTAYYRDMVDYLRTEVGVKIPIAGTNLNYGAPALVSDARMDFTDCHVAWDHPDAATDTIVNTAMVRASPLDGDPGGGTELPRPGYLQVPGRPFVLSEGSAVWPNQYRAEIAPWLTATASVQGWSAITFHNFVNSHVPPKKLGHPFNWANDPVRYALFPALATMFHQGHLRPSPIRAIVRIPDPYAQPLGWHAYGVETRTAMPKYRMMTWLEGVWGVPQPEIGPDDVVLNPGQSAIGADEKSAADPYGQLEHDWDSGIVLIKSEMTQGAIGFIGGKSLDLGDVVVDVENPFAVVLLTSLDQRPIRRSRHMLITAVAQAENTDQVLQNYMIKRFLNWEVEEEGTTPVLSERVRGTITLPNQAGTYRAWALKTNGGRPTSRINVGGDTLEIGGRYRSLWYEVELSN